MSEAVFARSVPVARVRDLILCAKPRLTSLVVFTTAMGIWLAPVSIGIARAAIVVAATALLVASAQTLNSWMERENDALMIRTRNRPLPAGRLDPWVALGTGVLLGSFAIPALALVANPLTALLGAIAHLSYVLVYTPLKRVSPRALEVGALPGAIPPLMGWTAAQGEIGAPGWVLFGILFFWQLPHSLSISLYLKEDFRRGGIKVLPLVKGDGFARGYLLLQTSCLVLVSLSAVFLQIAGPIYLAASVLLGAGFLCFALAGIRRSAGTAWARRTFLYSLVYLTVLVSVLVLDAR